MTTQNQHVQDSAQDLALFHPAVRQWFSAVFDEPTRPQRLGWPVIARGQSTLILAPTGTGKTLAAFLWCINELMFAPVPEASRRCRVLYISPIKALAVDVERNLRSPLIGISQAAQRLGEPHHEVTVAIRSGDTTPGERAKFARHPADILITTPESLYLLLTSNAREALRSVRTVVIDEIHAVVSSKRGVHLALSLERLARLCDGPIQRIGLSATQRPLEEVANYLGGSTGTRREGAPPAQDESMEALLTEQPPAFNTFRPVTVVDAGEPKKFRLRVEVPVEDMARLDELDPLPSGPAVKGPVYPSIWSAIHPKLLQLVRKHRSTLIFVNSRRLAERISGAINELAGETLVRAHHGSVAVAQRKEIEDRLKLGTLRGLVATSSLELGIDMGAIDLVVQIESPASVASGIQRVGRSSHHVGGVSDAIIFPKYRADLVACAAITRAMYENNVESVRYPRNPLDVLAQQIVAMVAMDPWDVNELFDTVRGAAPYSSLTFTAFESVLDMLSGRYPSDEFAELRPRLTWDRVGNKISARQGSRRVAVINGGTIPDRGLYGVFLAGATKGARVGELDEEMVFESKPGDAIILGATTWRIESISHDRVLVSPAPGEPGKMPFWHGDTAPRPAEFGEFIGKMTRELIRMPRLLAFTKLVEQHSLDANAAENLLRYLEEQTLATAKVPSDDDIVIEICHDELGDRRICVLSPWGSRIHAPWCMAVTAKLRDELDMEVESMWSDDGFVLRLPSSAEPFDSSIVLVPPAEFRDLVLRQLGSTSLFAAKFREAAARALLLPKRRPGMRAALWQQRKRASDLLAVAARYSSFPILLETYRECIRDVFDLAGATAILGKVQQGAIHVTTVETSKPSPFAAALLFSYIANYIYEGDAPLAERRAHVLSIDQTQLEEILGDTDLRELLDANALEEIEARLQGLDPEYQAHHADGVHDLLLKLGDLSEEELAARCADLDLPLALKQLMDARRIVRVRIAGELRYIPAEYAGRYRDAWGTPIPPGLAEVFLARVVEPLSEIVRRYVRTHGPFTTADIAKRYDVRITELEPVLHAFHGQGKLLEGTFMPGGVHREWCDPDVLQQIRRKSLARLRREVEPVEQHTFARFLTRWQGLTLPRKGLDALLDAIETLQGSALLVSEIESEILPARITGYRSDDLDALMAAGEVVWAGVERNGDRDGRVALCLADAFPKLAPPAGTAVKDPPMSERAEKITEILRRQGALFFPAIHAAVGGGFPVETVDALWELVWSGRITNDTFHPLRNLRRPLNSRRDRAAFQEEKPGSAEFLRRLRSRRATRGPVQGRWSLIEISPPDAPNATQWSANVAQQLLARYGIVMRDVAIAESVPGGYNTVYPALRTMEESGWIRRGMFVAGLGAAQFAMPSAVDVLRSLRSAAENEEVLYLSATDPANPYGATLPWPQIEANPETEASSGYHGMARASGAGVILVNGILAGFLRKRNPAIRVFLPDSDPERSSIAHSLAGRLARLALERQARRSGLLIGTINDVPAREHFLGRFLEEAGFINTALGYQMRRVAPVVTPIRTTPEAEQLDLDEADISEMG